MGPATRFLSTTRRWSTRSRFSPRSRLNDKFVDGGATAVAATDFRDSPKGLFALPPKCYLHRQASFIPSFFPEGTKLGEDADFFYFLPIDRSPISASQCSAAARLR